MRTFAHAISTNVSLAGALIAGIFGFAPAAFGQHHAPAALSAQPQPATFAGTSQPATLPHSEVPAPTVVLNPGEVPGISFKDTTFDFGRAYSRTEVTHDFEFTNTGNGPLEILQVKPG
jgi:hypothetical protein